MTTPGQKTSISSTNSRAKIIFVITTDGMENASKNYSYDRIQKMVKRQEEKYGWEFIFIGANIDAYAEAQRLGVRKERAVNYVHDDIGTAKVYAGVSSMVCKSMKVPDFLLRKELDESNWAEEINEDYNRRGKKAARR